MRSADMATPERRIIDGEARWFLADRQLANGDEVELRLRANQGWTTVRIDALPQRLIVVWNADDGRLVRATAEDADLRWP
jgi:hypothetical protein